MHRIAMVQLSPAALGNDMAAIELRMRELARTIPPTDIQLYYQTLLIGRKELPYAPDRRMGVEMTLLRALAFHPRMPLPDPEVPRQSFAPVAPTAVMTPTQVPPQPQSAPQQAPTVPLPETTSQVLAARQQLQRVQGATKAKKSEPAAATRARPVNNAALGTASKDWLRSPIAFRRARCHRRWKKRQPKKKRIAGRRPLQ
ncbi:hypothetical protein EIMP300_73820 [Escherichia coli]|uniref:DNA polymerase III gamma subunit domain-containing protein n=1 Tax=Escherichia coli TaxID=562 RepID=A0A8S0G041_ECOLX|nr:hypothetical protein EIMP300_73820 [Escherichia coli]